MACVLAGGGIKRGYAHGTTDGQGMAPDKDPVTVTTEHGSTVACWLHGPEELIPPGGTAPLTREEISIADEA